MYRIPIGQFIRERRQEKGITQEKLCSGICDVATLSRIENGRIIPRNLILHALLDKLGIPDTYYTVPMDEYEKRIRPLQEEARARVIAFGKAGWADKAARREEALSALQELEELAEKDDRSTRQRVLGDRVTLGTPEGPYPAEKQRELLLEALGLTISNFDISRIDDFRYTQEETGLINRIAITYVLEENRETAIFIYRQLLDYIQENNRQLFRYAGQLTMVTFNLARELSIEARYQEAINIAESGRKACVKYDDHQVHPQLLAILANCYAHLNRKEESEEFYRQAYYLYKAFEDLEGITHLKNDARDTLQLQLP